MRGLYVDLVWVCPWPPTDEQLLLSLAVPSLCRDGRGQSQLAYSPSLKGKSESLMAYCHVSGKVNASVGHP